MRNCKQPRDRPHLDDRNELVCVGGMNHRARIDEPKSGPAIEGRGYGRELELQLRHLDRRLIGFESGLRRCDLRALGVKGLLGGHTFCFKPH